MSYTHTNTEKCKAVLQIHLKEIKNNFLMGKRLEQSFTKENIQMAKKTWKGVQHHWSSGKCNLKATVKSNYITIKIVAIKKQYQVLVSIQSN